MVGQKLSQEKYPFVTVWAHGDIIVLLHSDTDTTIQYLTQSLYIDTEQISCCYNEVTLSAKLGSV